MRVLALTRYSSLGPSSRIRFYQYLPYLTAHGIDLQLYPLLGDYYVRGLYNMAPQPVVPVLKAYLDRIGQCMDSRTYDLIWMEKELLPWLPVWIERILIRSGIPYVADYDDAIFHRYNLNPSFLIRKMMGKSIDVIMRHATSVVVGNEYLSDYARGIGVDKIEYLPSVVDLDRYSVLEKSSKQFRIGWIGSPITAPYLALIKDALNEVREQTGACIVLIGAGERNPLNNDEIESLPWSLENEVRDLQSLDVGIMPLPDEPFERGKCGYKLVQYMACGLPAVASPVGVNTHLVDQDRTGFLASSHADWVQSLVALYKDAGLRKKMGLAGRLKVEQEFSLHVTAPRLLDILTKAASQRMD